MFSRIAWSAIAMVLARSMSGFFSRLLFALRQLWHEVVGFVFLSLSVLGGSATLREWRGGNNSGILLAASFTLMMAWFGVTSFRTARKVRESGSRQS